MDFRLRARMPSKGFEQSVVIKCSSSDYSQRRNQTAASLEVRTLVCVGGWGEEGLQLYRECMILV